MRARAATRLVSGLARTGFAVAADGMRVSKRLLLAAATTAAVFAAGEPAAAKPVSAAAAGKYVDVTGPRLAGSQLAWGQRSGRRALRVRAAGLPGLRGARTLFTTSDTGFLAATPSLVAARGAGITEPQYGLPGHVTDLGTTAFFGGRVLQVAAPCSARTACGPPEIAADGNRVLLSDGSGAYRLTDVAKGTTQATPAKAPGARVAGRFVAWVEQQQAVVFDLESGREAYRVAGVVSPTSFDLQADGKAVFVVKAPGGSRLAWASSAEPRVHRLGVPAIEGSYTPVIENDRVAFMRENNDDWGDLGVVGLSGPARILVRHALPSEGNAKRYRTFDFDGRRLAWAARGCSGQRMVSATLRDLRRSSVNNRLTHCPLTGVSVRSAPTNIQLRFDCAGFRRAECVGEKVVVRTTRSYRIGNHRIARGTALTKSAAAGGDRIIPEYLKLTSAGKRLVGARDGIRARVSGRFSDGLNHSQVRSAKTFIRRVP